MRQYKPVQSNILAAIVYAAVILLFQTSCAALNLDKVKISLLQGDYKAAISEGEKILAAANKDTGGLDELYYLLGLGYLKDGNYLRASDIFEIIIKEFSHNKFSKRAELGLGDAYFLSGDLDKAEEQYKAVCRTELKAEAYHRLSQLEAKRGNRQESADYASMLKKEFPGRTGSLFFQNPALTSQGQPYYSVQVGAFSAKQNAEKLKQELVGKGYDAYVQEPISEGSVTMYRVKVGKLSRHSEAQELETKLIREGYPTKICP